MRENVIATGLQRPVVHLGDCVRVFGSEEVSVPLPSEMGWPCHQNSRKSPAKTAAVW